MASVSRADLDLAADLGREHARVGSGQPVYSGLRLVRTLAMLSIVGYHVSWEPLFGVAFGLTCLQVVMCALAGRRSAAKPLGSFASKRAKRLLVPWIFWSVAYGVFEIVRSVRAGEAPGARFETWMWASGTSFHLWFLPFAFIASLIVNRVQYLLRRCGVEGVIAVASLVGIGLLIAAGPLRSALDPPMPYYLWIDGAPAVGFGLALGRSLSLRVARERVSGIVFLGLVSVLPFLLGGSLLPASPLFAKYGIAVPLACCAFLIRIPESKTLALLASFNLGVYLVHMLAIRVVDHIPGALELAAAPRTVAVYVACLLGVAVVRRLRIPHIA